ncbi:hypothetical protein K2173_026855 [Erythroxylum novogranatense]|uniref:Pentatricopeptide repeat-containing protein n=1 Tax=Erythroxylum novogranatense TaxID=1862640 RepID=A0AAV8U177_9ROSI|nr:hypothetical protein K2173_026855 [Erythroxylum novogranatense]
MYPFLNPTRKVAVSSLSYYSRLLDDCVSLRSLNLAQDVHAQLIKVGFNRHTLLGTRCLDLYSRFGSIDDALKVFADITDKNVVSWNILLRGLLNHGRFHFARGLFDEMPERDVVSLNSMISGYRSCGYFDHALGTFREMQNMGLEPSVYTYSILTSVVSCARHSKELHGKIIRSGFNVSSLILGNSLIDVYAKIGLVHYAFGVFLTMEELDVISWNSLIAGFGKSGCYELALDQFCLMRSRGYLPDEFTCSTLVNCCSKLRNLNKGMQIFAFSVKLGFICNSIVSSAAIDLFSKCNRLEDSVGVFEELDHWDSALCNSMISSYALHGFWENALHLFVFTMKNEIRPTEFTLSCIISSIPILPVEQGMQIHGLALKLGFELQTAVASALVDMYSKFGHIDLAIEIFSKIIDKDLISWNTMIKGLAENGRVLEALHAFEKLLRRGHPHPDHITVTEVLLACSYGGLVKEGVAIFSAMEEKYGIKPGNEHYACLVDLMCRCGRLHQAVDVIKAMPCEPGPVIWESLLHACVTYGDSRITESAARRLMDLEPESSLAFIVLSRAYEMRGNWEGMIRVRKMMRQRMVNKATGCSWIGTGNHVYSFKANQLHHYGGKEIYLTLGLLNWEMEDEICTVRLCQCIFKAGN